MRIVKRGRLAAASLVIVLSFLWWLPFSIEPPGRDQSLFMAQSQALLDGSSLYTEVWEQKPPGILFAYSLAQALAGHGEDAGEQQPQDEHEHHCDCGTA